MPPFKSLTKRQEAERAREAADGLTQSPPPSADATTATATAPSPMLPPAATVDAAAAVTMPAEASVAAPAPAPALPPPAAPKPLVATTAPVLSVKPCVVRFLQRKDKKGPVVPWTQPLSLDTRFGECNREGVPLAKPTKADTSKTEAARRVDTATRDQLLMFMLGDGVLVTDDPDMPELRARCHAVRERHHAAGRYTYRTAPKAVAGAGDVVDAAAYLRMVAENAEAEAATGLDAPT